jgi:hypothetical protein
MTQCPELVLLSSMLDTGSAPFLANETRKVLVTQPRLRTLCFLSLEPTRILIFRVSAKSTAEFLHRFMLILLAAIATLSQILPQTFAPLIGTPFISRYVQRRASIVVSRHTDANPTPCGILSDL